MLRFTALLLACSCTKGDSAGETDEASDDSGLPPGCALSFETQPEIRGADPLMPLSRAVTLTLSEPASLAITATDATGEVVAWSSPTATVHDLALVGLHADGEWALSVQAEGEDGCTAEATAVAFTTDSLPSPLPILDVLAADPGAMEPGYTLIPIYTKDISYLSLVDDAGRIVWIYGPVVDKFTEVRQLPSGNLLALTDVDILEFDWMGVVRAWTAESSPRVGGIPVALPHFHHDVLWTSRDTIVVLSKGTAAYDNFPLSEQNVAQQGPASVAVDRIVELETDGTIVAEWEVTDMLDLERLGYDSLTRATEGYEWSHNNSIEEDVGNGRWILSARNQDAVFAVQQESGSVDWILANPDNWHDPYRDWLLTGEGSPFEWPYHQHAAKYDAASSRILLFDNGNARASPWTGVPPMASRDSYSRVVEYTLDEAGKTVSQRWDFRLDPSVFSFAMGDADWLPNGNVLADFAYIEWEGGEELEAQGRGNNAFRVVEFEPLTGTTVWELDVWGRLEDDPNAWQAYRTQRIPRPSAP